TRKVEGDFKRNPAVFKLLEGNQAVPLRIIKGPKDLSDIYQQLSALSNQRPPAITIADLLRGISAWQTQGYQSPTVTVKQQYPGYQSPTTTTYQQLNQVKFYQQNQIVSVLESDYQQTQQPANLSAELNNKLEARRTIQPKSATNWLSAKSAFSPALNYQQNPAVILSLTNSSPTTNTT
ncbi:hypothetical protein TNIN_239321, partial [Trichonephila inaurata madagascariensis]